MAFSAKILCDSIAPHGARLTTFEITFPRIILAELNTHRMLSRNTASSRAIPIEKMIARVKDDPYVPLSWGRNQKGMVAASEISPDDRDDAVAEWLAARDHAVKSAKRLSEMHVHKQIVNRLLEPFLFVTTIVSMTEFANFAALRTAPDAQPEIQRIATLMLDAYRTNTPTRVHYDGWHLPLIQPDELHLPIATLRRVSAGRCARISYLTHDGRRDISEDIALYERLTTSHHWSPLEHQATPAASAQVSSGNFRGWLQFRKSFVTENITTLPNLTQVAS